MIAIDKDEELTKALMEAIARFNRNIHSVFHRSLGPEHRPAQFFVLAKIRKEGPPDGSGLRVSDIATGLGVTASSVTQIVTDLESKGLVARTMDPQDRRVVRVSLTPAGLGLLAASRNPYTEKTADLANYLGEEKSRALIALLGEVDEFMLRDGQKASACPGGAPKASNKENL